MFWLYVIAGVSFIAMIAMAVMLFLQYYRFTTIIRNQEQQLAEERRYSFNRTASFQKETELLQAEKSNMLKRQNELTEQKFTMAEANLSMLEYREQLTEQKKQLERQKFAMAEANLQLYGLNEKLKEEEKKSAKLLRNILPERVIVELGKKGKSEPEMFDNVTVFFSDIVGFTTISGTLEPARLISELNDIFTAFDHIFVRNHCERIKTIGDAYLSVSGMPDPDENHAGNVLKSAIEARKYLEKRNETHPLQWQMRMGIHSGKVVGGIVGVEKYIYDVFGDTINTAARMEQYSETMQINVSETTFLKSSDNFCFTPRTPVEVKGKGVMKMYFLNAERMPGSEA